MSLQPKPLPAAAIQPIGINDIMVALERIEPGQPVVYHCGNLSDDRKNHETDARSREIHMIADRAYGMATDPFRPRIHLTQFRLVGSNNFAYVATGMAGCDRQMPH